jgi:hypothetical protein
MALAELYARAGQPQRARALLRRFEQEVPGQQQALAGKTMVFVQALIALAERRLDDAELLFASADHAVETPLLVLPFVARIHELRGESAQALAAYRSYLDARAVGRLQYDALYLGRVLGRVAALEEAQGHEVAASTARRRLAELWAQADPGVRARLGSAPPPSTGLL